MKYTRFTEGRLLWRIGRPLLERLFNQFETALKEKGVEPPGPGLQDDDYFTAWNNLLMSPEGLPAQLNEALHLSLDLATSKGADSIRRALAHGECEIGEDLAPEQLALKAWLHSPELLAKIRNEQHLQRLSAFEYFERNPEAPLEDSRMERVTLDNLVEMLDEWFAAHGRGRETTVIEVFQFGDWDEQWFMIRHGDSATRSPKVDKRRLEVLHFRPATDDVVVYSERRQELRIHARTKAEAALYRKAFGRLFGGTSDYFRAAKSFTLEPLRTEQRDSLFCSDIPGIKKVVLKELDYDLGTANGASCLMRADDLFDSPLVAKDSDLGTPSGVTLTRAKFSMQFGAGTDPLEFHIQPPNTLRMARHGSAALVHDWAQARGFKVTHTAEGTRKTDAAIFWDGLERTVGLEGVLATWKLNLGAFYETFKIAFLCPTGFEATHVPTMVGCGCHLEVKRLGDGSIIVLANEHCGVCDNQLLQPDDIAIWELNLGRLGRAIARAFECEPHELDYRLPHTMQITSFGGAGIPIILTIQPDFASFEAIVLKLAAKRIGHCVLLAPTRRFLTPDISSVLAHEKITFFDLASILSLLPSGKLVASKTGGELFSPCLPAMEKPMNEQRAAELFRMVRILGSQAHVRKGRLIDVFINIVLEGRTQKETARICGCGEGSISARVKHLETALECPLDSLRCLYAGVASSLKEAMYQEARSIHEPNFEDAADSDDEVDSEAA